MQEVFEKIIESLEEYRNGFMENVYEELKDDSDNIRANNIIDGFDTAIEIVKQAVAEYNNGWILCSSGKLPEENEDVEVTIEEIADDVGGKRYYNMRSWLQDGQWVIKKNPYHPTVIAWKYPTEPYQPKGDRTNCVHRHENGNCLAVGGFCTAVDDKYCKYQPMGE
ncbi:MAG: hypothetical protein ACI4DR_01635 [Roseburia sp.]